MAVLAARTWPSWRRTGLQPKGRRFDSPHARPKLGTDLRRKGFAAKGADFRPCVAEIGAEFPEKLRARRPCWKLWVNTAQEKKDPSLQNIVIFICKHYIQILFHAIHNPRSNATNLPGRRLTGASLFKSSDAQGI